MLYKPSLVIVSPALADQNNGNWQTARRWQQLLGGRFHVRIVKNWQAGCSADHIMIALHARRSADSIDAWHQAHGNSGLVVALTGTDLYKDLDYDTSAQRSVEQAQALIVLQDQAPLKLNTHLRTKTHVVFQSCSARKTLTKTKRHLNVVMVGHLRDEKLPGTLMEAAVLLKNEPAIHIAHIGAALDESLGQQATATMKLNANYSWLGAQNHPLTRKRIQRAHVLVHTSKMEGGAHVVMEAVRSGTPVLASKMDGNVGMLGADYQGYFPVGDATALADLLKTLLQNNLKPESSGLLHTLTQQCQARAALFTPAHEQQSLFNLLKHLKHHGHAEH